MRCWLIAATLCSCLQTQLKHFWPLMLKNQRTLFLRLCPFSLHYKIKSVLVIILNMFILNMSTKGWKKYIFQRTCYFGIPIFSLFLLLHSRSIHFTINRTSTGFMHVCICACNDDVTAESCLLVSIYRENGIHRYSWWCCTLQFIIYVKHWNSI